MRIVFVVGTQLFDSNYGLIENTGNIKEDIYVIYFNDIEFSYEYAKKETQNNQVKFFGSIEDIFSKLNLKNDLYTFSFFDYIIHIKKNNKKVKISFGPTLSDKEASIISYIKNSECISFMNIFNSQITKGVINYIIDKIFFPYNFVCIVLIIIISYKLFYISEHTSAQKYIIDFLNS